MWRRTSSFSRTTAALSLAAVYLATLATRAADDTSYREFLSLWEDTLKRTRRINVRSARILGSVSIKHDSLDNM